MCATRKSKRSARKRTKVVFASYRGAIFSEATGSAGGSSLKPFDAQELLVRVRNLIANRKVLQEKYRTSVPLKPGEVKVESLDDKFLLKVMAVVESHISEDQFDVEQFAYQTHLGRGQLHRKLKALTNLSPTDFIRYIRLQRAKELLEKKAGSVSEVAYQVGFTNHSYFAKCFKEQFGCLPSEVGRP